jgi:drug/metabolite transporter (DMT)-like permease
MSQSPQITATSWLMIATLGLTWGGTFLVMEIALMGMTPFWLAAGRIGFAPLLMLVIWAARGWRLFEVPVARCQWAVVGVIGALSSAVPFMLLAWGQQFVTSGFAGVSMAAVALIVLPLAHFLVPGERFTLRKGIGFGIGFVGVCILIGAQAFNSTGIAQEPAGRLACLSAAFCYAWSSVLMRRLPPVDPIGLATTLLCIGAAIVIPLAIVIEGPPPGLDARTLTAVVFLGLIPTAGASLLRVLVVRSAGPVFMSLTAYQVPVWSVVLGAAILDEPLPSTLLLAMALILCGVAIIQYGALRRLFTGS